jgi:hypothetical protein
MVPLIDPSLRLYASASAAWAVTRHEVRGRLVRRRSDDRGEGVISAAIVVLIMAAIGALMWVAFKEIWEGVEADTKAKVDSVGD